MSRNTDLLLDRIVIALREEPVPEFVDSLPASQSSAMTHRSVNRSPVNEPRFFHWRTSSRRLMAGAAIAISVSLLVAISITVPGAHPSAAFGEVQQAVSAFKSVRYRRLDYHGDKDPYITTITSVRGIGSRGEASAGSESITNVKARRMLWLDHRARKARLFQIYLEDGKETADAFDEKLRNLPATAKALGPAEFDGKKMLKFAFSNLGEFVVLADPQTKLPLRMELTIEKGRPGGSSFREVITDFVFDAQFNASLFNLDIPPGYAIERCEEPLDRKPLDTRTLIVSPATGVGPVPFGASKNDVIAFFGAPDWIEIQGRSAKMSASPGDAPASAHAQIVHERLHYNSLGFEINISSENGMREFRCLPRSSIAREFLGKTDTSIRLGSSIDDVIKAYGMPEVRSHFREDVLRYLHKGWSFVFGNGKLASYSAVKPMSDEIEIEDHGDGSFTERVKVKKPSP